MSTVSLADARLLHAARSGAPHAAAAIWKQWRTPIWSVVLAMTQDKARALAELRELYQDLPSAARQWSPQEDLCCHISAWVFRRLQHSLELPEVAGIEVVVPHAVASPTQSQAAERIRSLAPQIRLVYLIDLFFRCPASVTAGLLGIAENDLRHARSNAAWAVVAGGAP